MRIGELAELAGVTTRTVRHYHRIGLLPEPARAGNDYREYQLRDAVALIRIRRLVELGLSLSEAADALADDEGRDLRVILVDMAADLSAQEERIRARREQLDRLLASDDDLTMSAELNEALRELTRVTGPGHALIDRERLVLQATEPLIESDAAEFWAAYRQVLNNSDLVAGAVDLERRFAALADVAPDDPAVDELAEHARVLGEAVFAQVPAAGGVDDAQSGARGDEVLLRTMAAGLPPAQVRCLTLMFGHWQDAGS